MSSFMRSVERQKVRTQMEKQGVAKVSKRLKPWFTEYKEKKHEYIVSGAWAAEREKYNNRKKGNKHAKSSSET